MRLFAKAAALMASGMRSLPLFGGQGQQGHFGRWFAPGSRVDWSREVGRVYDNAVVSIALGWITRNFPDAPLQVLRTDEDGNAKAVPHQLLRIVKRPNPWYDQTVLWAGTLLSWNVSGNAYWYKLRSAAGQVAGFLYLPHFQVRPMADEGNPGGTQLVTYYEYTPLGGGQKIKLPPADVVHFRFGIDPQNPMQGLSPLAAVFREIGSDNLAATYSAALLHNMGVPGAVFVPKSDPKGAPTPEQKQQFKELFQRTFTGDGAGTAMVLPFPMEVASLGFKPQEMALDSLREVPVDRICAAMGLDAMVLGLTRKSTTFANKEEAAEAAYEENLIPTKRMIGEQLEWQVLHGDFGALDLSLGWDYSNVRALQDDLNELWKRNTDAFAKGVLKRKEAKSNLAQPFDETEDDVYVQDLIMGLGGPAKALVRAAGERARRRRELLEFTEDDDATDGDIAPGETD